jgi:hypothetical protein
LVNGHEVALRQVGCAGLPQEPTGLIASLHYISTAKIRSLKNAMELLKRHHDPQNKKKKQKGE